ncbi:MAG: RagB/SusD family nutrient uptake outer membrane protein [Acidobacterium ailaaui]|nr:RagB/SusD family nutrient uptake outer membrane protein [Pseudacidobacterium ailaaui]
MKNNNFNTATKVVIMVFLLITLFSCKKSFLDITPRHYLTDEDFYINDSDFIQSTNAVYGDMQEFILKAHILEEGRSDNTTYDNYLDQGLLGGSMQLGLIDQFKETSDAQPIADAWNVIYSAIKDCNETLWHLRTAKINPSLALRLSGELRFFRAYFYFIAVQYWGDVPLLTSPINTAEEAFAIRRSPVSDVYNTIINDAQFADSTLPLKYTGADIGRITSGAAKMLLANVFMTLHKYSEAEVYLRAIINSHVYSLLPNYADIFNPNNKNNAESIFEVQFKDGPEGEASNFIYQFAPVGSKGKVFVGPGTGGGNNIPTKDMVEAYEPHDLRKDVSIGYIIRNNDTVYYVKKYAHSSNTSYPTTPDDWPVYRYADVLLLLAEAINEQGYQTGEPFNLLNEIRNRAGLPPLTPLDLPDQQSFREALAHERRVELAFENHRWFDLLRTGTAISVMTAYGKKEIANPTTPPPNYLPYDSTSFVITKNKLLYPIPAAELVLDPNLTQNPGY